MQLLSKAYLIIFLLINGCIKCPDSVSMKPIGYYQNSRFDFDGAYVSATWYLPVDKNTICNKIKFEDKSNVKK